MKRDQVIGFSFCVLSIVGMSAAAADWPKWRGPDGDGTTTAKIDPAFAKGGIDVAWSKDLGVGFTAVTIADGTAFSAGWSGGETTFFAFDAKTGEKKWSHTFKSPKFDNLNVGGPRGTAAVDAGHVYFMGGGGEMFCFKADTGDIVWEKNLSKTYGIKAPTWGFSGSPVVIDDTVYLDFGRVLALNKKTGDEVWKTDNWGAAYSTPAPFTYKGKDYLAVFPGKGLYVIDRATGKQVAHKPWKTSYDVNAATPVVIDNTIFISSDYNTGCALLTFTGSALDLRWENKNLKNQMCTSVYVDGYLYGFDSSKLTCIDAKTGKKIWDERGMGRGTVIASGKTLIVLSEKGEVITAEATPRGFRPVSKVSVVEGDDTVWTAPALANGKLYVRGSRGKLVCVDVSK